MSAATASSGAVLIFARAPEPGEAKTRLIPALGAQGAACLQARMTRRAVSEAGRAAVGAVQLWCTPRADHPFFDPWAVSREVRLCTQQGADLGARLRHAHDVAFDRYERLLIMGTDCPLLTESTLRAAATDIARYDAVVIPAEDGGYVLLGLSRPCPEAFRDIAWGTERVCEQTLRQLRATEHRYMVYEPLWDVDRPEDLLRLQSLVPELVAGLGADAPAARKRVPE